MNAAEFSRPLALDLFCGAGGASMGLHRAGFDVIGVDVRPQPRYPFTFIQADATRPPIDVSRFALIWASPPCQAFSSASACARKNGKQYPNLIDQVRQLLSSSGCAFTIMENVQRAPLRPDVVLDGTMFPPLRVIRKRVFELSWFVLGPTSRVRRGLTFEGWSTVVGHDCGSRLLKATAGRAREWNNAASWRRAMGIDWMIRSELTQAIPPAYAEWLARQAINAGAGIEVAV